MLPDFLPVRGDQTAPLEQSFIDEFLERRGLTRAMLSNLPSSEIHLIMLEATMYASVRLAEVEARAHYVHDLHRTE
jgi:hypothetical protein